MIIFRTHGGQNTGLGHLMRSLSLARAVREGSDHPILFVVNKEISDIVASWDFQYGESETFDKEDLARLSKNKPDLVVFDSYTADESYLSDLRRFAKVAMFDDNNDLYPHLPVDIVINGNLHARSLDYKPADPNTKLLLGPEYLVMKPEYWNRVKTRSHKGRLLIMTGGADIHNLMPRFMEALRSLDCPKTIILGPAFSANQVKSIENAGRSDFQLISKPESLKPYILDSSLVVTACASTVYEILTLSGIPVIYELADNQRLLASVLREKGVTDLGWWSEISWNNLPNIISKDLSRDVSQLSSLIHSLDGTGARRIAGILIDLVNKPPLIPGKTPQGK